MKKRRTYDEWYRNLTYVGEGHGKSVPLSDMPEEFELYVWGTLMRGCHNHFYMKKNGARYLRSADYTSEKCPGPGEIYTMRKSASLPVHMLELRCGFVLFRLKDGVVVYLHDHIGAAREISKL